MQNDFNFESDVIQASDATPIVVDFWAEWCAPCRVLGPVLEKLAEEADTDWKLVKINTERQPELASRFRIQGIPAVKMISKGEVIAEFVGALPEAQIRRWLDDHLPTESGQKLAEARIALQSGDTAEAQSLLETFVRMDPSNNEARLLLARLIFDSEPQKTFDLVKDIQPGDPAYSDAENIMTLSRLRNQIDDLQDRAGSADNGGAWQHYVSGVRALRKKDYEKALQEWIEALILGRDIDDDGPRKACVALFSLLGQEHALTREYHRRFTSALF